MRSDLIGLMAAMGLGAAFLTGCNAQRSVAESSLVDNPAALEDETEFIDGLSEQITVTNHDALHGLLLLADQEDAFATYEERVAAAKDRGWLTSDWDRPANESARIGDIAQALCVITNIDGGVTMRLFGPSPRYATRELVYLEVIPDRTETQSVRGLEFLELMLLANDRIRGGDRPGSVDERLRQIEEAKSQRTEEQGTEPAVEPVPGTPEAGSPEDPARNPR